MQEKDPNDPVKTRKGRIIASLIAVRARSPPSPQPSKLRKPPEHRLENVAITLERRIVTFTSMENQGIQLGPVETRRGGDSVATSTWVPAATS